MTTGDVAVLVLCRGDEIGNLAETVDCITRQEPEPAERLIVPYECSAGITPAEGWKVSRGDWKHPADALNHALATTTAPWLVVTQAGEVLPAGYVRATLDLVHGVPDDAGFVHHAGSACDYWSLRETNDFHPRTVVWRRTAVELSGGWPDRCASVPHYALALAVTAAGWKAVRHDLRFETERPAHDGTSTELAHDLWQARSVGIVSLLAGRSSMVARWEHFLMNAELPANTALYVVDNSARPEFTRSIHATCQRIAEARRLTHLDVSVIGRPHQATPHESYLARARNVHVAGLYSFVFPRVGEDLVLTLEDDIAPPLTAVRLLGEEFARPHARRLGAISATWDRVRSDYVCGGRDDGGWGSPIRWDELPDEPVDVGCVGGACTMWANSVLSTLPVNVRWDEELGWDGVLCTSMRERGCRVQIHGGVRCVHHTGGAIRASSRSPEMSG